jgi:hypothetical protein
MATSSVLRMSENFDTMTFSECLAFIERSRRQIIRLEHLPQEEGAVDPDAIASILQHLDALERSIRSHPSCPSTAASTLPGGARPRHRLLRALRGLFLRFRRRRV